MGLGKSAQAIHAADLINAKHILVLCPGIARFNWDREFKKFSTALRQSNVIISKKVAHTMPLTICSYDLLLNEQILSNLKSQKWDALILDESHYLKNPKATRSQKVFAKTGLAHFAKRIWCLTGTPLPNGCPNEMWVMLRAFGKTNLSYEDFIKKFCNYYLFNFEPKVTGAKRITLSEFKALIKPLCLRRSVEEVMPELPKIKCTHTVVEPGPVAMDESHSFVKFIATNRGMDHFKTTMTEETNLLESILGTGRQTDQMRLLEALAPSVPTLRRYVGIQKIQGTVDLAKEFLDNEHTGLNKRFRGRKLVLFAVHQEVIEGLRRGLLEYSPLTIYGGTPHEKRQSHLDKFQTDTKHRVFIGQIHACGIAINLTAANHIFMVESDWVPTTILQAIMRCRRIGQTETVHVKFLGVANSIDEHITRVLQLKTNEIAKVFDENHLTPQIFNPKTEASFTKNGNEMPEIDTDSNE